MKNPNTTFLAFVIWIASMISFLGFFRTSSYLEVISPMIDRLMFGSMISGSVAFVVFIISWLFMLEKGTNKRNTLYYFISTIVIISLVASVFVITVLRAPTASEESSTVPSGTTQQLRVWRDSAKTEIETQSVVDTINQVRALNAVAPVTRNVQLDQAAQAKASDMCSKKYWDHTSPEGKEPWYWIQQAGYNYLVAGENLGRDFNQMKELEDAWMNSASHKKNIIDATFTQTGVAKSTCQMEGYQSVVFVQMFAAPTVPGQGLNTLSTTNPNEPILCPINESCGGGTMPLTRRECENSICCQKSDASWEVYLDKNKCLEEQQAN